MNALVIWIDREHAKLFAISEEKMERKNLAVHRQDHHTHRRDGSDHEREEHRLFKTVVDELRDADRVLILGPGVAKHHFQTFLMEHFPALAKKVAGCETVDHPTDGQIAALAKRFFGIGKPVAVAKG